MPTADGILFRKVYVESARSTEVLAAELGLPEKSQFGLTLELL